MAPRKVSDLREALQPFFEAQDQDADDTLEEDDLEIFGQLDFLVQQGPQIAILAVKDDWNNANEVYHPLEPAGSLPTHGSRIAMCFWGPVKKHRISEDNKDKFIVSKQIDLRKLRKNQNSRQKFNDYPPSEIATHRFLNAYSSYVPKMAAKCEYIVNLRGVTKDENDSAVYYYMDFGKDYFAQISEGYERALRAWKKDLRSKQRGRQYIKQNKSPWETARCKDFVKLAKGMEFMHKLGVTHRDFKLENIVMGLDGDVKIIDFGVAHRFGLWEQTGPKAFCAKDRVGTATYMSPECSWATKSRKNQEGMHLDNWDYWDSRANDLWTLGVALFMMLFACPPYDACSNSDNRFVYLTEGSYIPPDKKSTKPRNASLRSLVKAYRRLDMVTEECLAFLEQFFKPESARIDWESIKSNPWLRDEWNAETEEN